MKLSFLKDPFLILKTFFDETIEEFEELVMKSAGNFFVEMHFGLITIGLFPSVALIIVVLIVVGDRNLGTCLNGINFFALSSGFSFDFIDPIFAEESLSIGLSTV
jgi:hypothetical protein